MASPRESSSLCLKRKLVEDYLSKESKSRRIEAKNGSSFDSSAKRCNCSCIRPNIANDCVNFLKSGVPSCIMYYKQGSWCNFPEKIMKSLIEEFSGNKSSVVSVMDDEPILVDFLSMTMVNLKSRKQQSVAWCDDTGKCFSPSLSFDEEINDMVKGDASVQGTAQGIILDKIAISPAEEVKQVVTESSSQVTHNTDVLRKKITAVERASNDFLFVQDLFLSGMGPFATPNNLLRVYRYSPNDITAHCRLEAFERQIGSTKEERGDANVRYGWLGSRKNNIVRILINGLGTTGKPGEKSGLSAGVYLSPVGRTFTSVGLCDVDEKGVQYMLLCRVILGNMEAVEPGSHESFPTSEIYDSGVDDCLNPKCYVMWPSHLSTHLRLEYLVSFKLAPEIRNYLIDLKGLWFHPSPKEVVVDISSLQPVWCEAGQGPTSPWISFRDLFGLIQDKISPIARELLFHHYEDLKESKITREQMVKKMMILVGEKMLTEALKELHYCPSLWYKSSAVTSDPAKMEAEQIALDAAGRNCSLTLSGNHGDSQEHHGVPETSGSAGAKCLAPSGVPETSSSAGAKCLAPSLVPETSSSAGAKILAPNGVSETSGSAGAKFLAPSGVPDTFSSNGSKCLGSKRVEPEGREGQEFLSLGMASQSPALRSVKGPDALTSAAKPPVYPPGCGKSPGVSSRARDPPAPRAVPKGHEPSAPPRAVPQRHERPPSVAEPKRHEPPAAAHATPESRRPQAMHQNAVALKPASVAATKALDASTQTVRVAKERAAQNKLTGAGDGGAGSHIIRAAGTLVALSAPREKVER
ncbi:hypothetical protein U9M48_034257 [Paspalum notatum var. saurae]|uniref:Poly [ADP-ribose] polymerase n=1 Tax=Paspalum notatum var. saurae TaxID=547442 RepID=A0AAQ3X6Y2_PASNO